MPQDPIVPPLRVPYVCHALEPYDGDAWLTYPARAGWPQVLPSALYPQFSKHELNHPSDDRKLESFFQSWLFFGLLSHMLHEYGLYNAHDYIGRDREGQYVHTKKLLDRLWSWQ